MESVLRSLFAKGNAQNLYIVRCDEDAAAAGSSQESLVDAHRHVRAAVLSLAKEAYVPVKEVSEWNTSAELIEQMEQKGRADALLAQQREAIISPRDQISRPASVTIPLHAPNSVVLPPAAAEQLPSPTQTMGIAWGELCKRKLWVVCPFGACSDRNLLRSAAVEVLCARTYQCHPSFKIVLLCTQKEFDRLPRVVRVLSGIKFGFQRYAVIPRHYCRYFCSPLAHRLHQPIATFLALQQTMAIGSASGGSSAATPLGGGYGNAAAGGEEDIATEPPSPSSRLPATAASDSNTTVALLVANEKKDRLALQQKQRLVAKPEYIDEEIEDYLGYEDCEIAADAPGLVDFQEQVFNSDPRIRIVKYQRSIYGSRGDVFIRIMRDALKFNVVVHTLDLTGCRGGDAVCRALSSILHTTRKLHHLNLSECSLTDAGIVELAAALRKNEHIWTINLSRNPMISDVGLVALTTIFGPGTQSRLEGLDLSHNNAVYDKEKQWSRDALNTLWEALPRHPFLKYVSFADCGLAARHVIELSVRWLGKYRRVTYEEFLAENDPNEDYHTAALRARKEKKKRLALQKVQQGSDAVDSKATGKTAQEELEEMEEELLSDAERAERAAARRVDEERLRLQVENRQFEAGIVSLNLSDNPIGDAAMGLLFQSLPLNLKRLSVQHTGMGASGLRALGFAITTNSLQLEEVNVSQNNTSICLRKHTGDMSSSDSDDDDVAGDQGGEEGHLIDALYRSPGQPTNLKRSHQERLKRWAALSITRRGKMLLQRAIRAARRERLAADPMTFSPPTLQDADWSRTIPDVVSAATVSQSLLRASETVGTARWDVAAGACYPIYSLSPTFAMYQEQAAREQAQNHKEESCHRGLDTDLRQGTTAAAAPPGAMSALTLREVLREELTLAATTGAASGGYRSIKAIFTDSISPSMRAVLQTDAILEHIRLNPDLMFEDKDALEASPQDHGASGAAFAQTDGSSELHASSSFAINRANVVAADVNRTTVSKMKAQGAFIRALEGNFTLHTLGLSKVFLEDSAVAVLCDQIISKLCGVRCLDISFNREIGEDCAHKIKELLVGGYAFADSVAKMEGSVLPNEGGSSSASGVRSRNRGRLGEGKGGGAGSAGGTGGGDEGDAFAEEVGISLPTAVPEAPSPGKPPLPSVIGSAISECLTPTSPLKGVLSPSRLQSPNPTATGARKNSVGFMAPDAAEAPIPMAPVPEHVATLNTSGNTNDRPGTGGSSSMVQFSFSSRPATGMSASGGGGSRMFGDDVVSLQSSTASMSSFYPDADGNAIETDVGVLQSLCLRGNVSDIGERTILALYQNYGLMHLDVRDMGLTDAMFQPLGDAVNPNNAASGGGPAAAAKAAAGRLFNPELCLRSVLLGRNTIYRGGMKSIAEFVRFSTTLDHLSLADTWFSFTDDLGNSSSLSKTKKDGLWFLEPLLEVISGGSYSCALLKSHSTLSGASGRPGAVGRLKGALSSSALGSSARSERSLYMCPSLRILDLSKNDIPQVVAEELLKAISTNETISTIILAENPLLCGEGSVLPGSVAEQKGFTDFSMWLVSEDPRFFFDVVGCE